MDEGARAPFRDHARLVKMTIRRVSRLANKAGAVPCDRIRQAISADIDGERPGVMTKMIDSHVTHSRGCQQYRAGIVALTRETNLQTSRLVPAGLKEPLGTEMRQVLGPAPLVAPRLPRHIRGIAPCRHSARWLGALAPAAFITVVLTLAHFRART
jgi:predicted anti-sigma-YlaC factor YlaD